LGVVISGKIEVRYPDRTEIYTAGDAYVIEPGHLPWPHSGSEVIEFTKTAEVAKTQAVVGANMAAQGASA
jgi:quercetin dioxygenase-like cupin family protein